MKVKKNRLNKIMKGIIISFCTLLVISCIFFINTMSVSAKTVKQKEITPDVYTLTLEERDGVKEQINGVDINFKYSKENSSGVTYDEKLLQVFINKLSCLDSSKIFKSQNVSFIYKDNSYTRCANF